MTNLEFALCQTGMILKMSKLPTTTRLKDGDSLPPIHPGDILRTEFMEPLNLSATQLALHMGIPLSRVTAIMNGTRGITADTALRLARVFSTSAELWLNLQSNYEIARLDYLGVRDKILKETRMLA
jgi:addiction module HigA family antidote